jgi:hypothetical protein
LFGTQSKPRCVCVCVCVSSHLVPGCVADYMCLCIFRLYAYFTFLLASLRNDYIYILYIHGVICVCIYLQYHYSNHSRHMTTYAHICYHMWFQGVWQTMYNMYIYSYILDATSGYCLTYVLVITFARSTLLLSYDLSLQTYISLG